MSVLGARVARYRRELEMIKVLALQLREAIEAVPREERPWSLQSFPDDACGGASLMLGQYLLDNGFDGFNTVCGVPRRPGANPLAQFFAGDPAHVWLARGDLVVDITVDQYEDGPSPIIVASPSLWHRRRFAIVFDDQPIGLQSHVGPRKAEFVAFYNRLRGDNAK